MASVEKFICDMCGHTPERLYFCERCHGEFCDACIMADTNLCDDCDAEREEAEGEQANA